MIQKKRFLRLESLVTYLQSEKDGDEIFIKYNEKKVFPTDAKFVKVLKEPVTMNVEIELNQEDKWVELELWDYDRFTPNDKLGTFKLLVDQVAEHFTAELDRAVASEGKYVLNWSVVERIRKPEQN